MYLPESKWLSLRKEVCIFADKHTTVISICLFGNCLETSITVNKRTQFKEILYNFLNEGMHTLVLIRPMVHLEASKQQAFLILFSSMRYFLSINHTSDMYTSLESSQRFAIGHNSQQCVRCHHVSDPWSHSTGWSGI